MHLMAKVVKMDETGRKSEVKKLWNRDELCSPAWLCAMARKEGLCDEITLQILAENEFDIFLLNKYGADTLRELGVPESQCKQLVSFAEATFRK